MAIHVLYKSLAAPGIPPVAIERNTCGDDAETEQRFARRLHESGSQQDYRSGGEERRNQQICGSTGAVSAMKDEYTGGRHRIEDPTREDD